MQVYELLNLPAVCLVICSSLARSFSLALRPMCRVMNAWCRNLSPASQCYICIEDQFMCITGGGEGGREGGKEGERREGVREGGGES